VNPTAKQGQREKSQWAVKAESGVMNPRTLFSVRRCRRLFTLSTRSTLQARCWEEVTVGETDRQESLRETLLVL